VRWLAELERGESRGADTATSSFSSGDGRSIGYFADSDPIQLRMVSICRWDTRILVSGNPAGPDSQVTCRFHPTVRPRAVGASSSCHFRGLLIVSEGQPPRMFADGRCEGRDQLRLPIVPDRTAVSWRVSVFQLAKVPDQARRERKALVLAIDEIATTLS
jgi:hypothetical protein